MLTDELSPYAYATTFDDQMPVCESCKDKLKANPARTCPVDRAEMKKIMVKNIVIDKCPKCNGIWLDGDEVHLLGNLVSGAIDNSWAKKNTQNNAGSGFWKGFIVGSIIS